MPERQIGPTTPESAGLSAADHESILALLSTYVEVVDNAAWDEEFSVFRSDATFGPGTSAGQPIAAIHNMLEGRPVPLFPHQCTNAVLTRVAPDTVRAWSKFFTVRADGTATSGDYLDTIRRSDDGAWRIAHRAVSLGNRPSSDPFGPSERVFTRRLWEQAPEPTGEDRVRRR